MNHIEIIYIWHIFACPRKRCVPSGRLSASPHYRMLPPQSTPILHAGDSHNVYRRHFAFTWPLSIISLNKTKNLRNNCWCIVVTKNVLLHYQIRQIIWRIVKSVREFLSIYAHKSLITTFIGILNHWLFSFRTSQCYRINSTSKSWYKSNKF